MITTQWRGCISITSVAVALSAHSPATLGHEFITGWEGNSSRGYVFVSPGVTFHQGSAPLSVIVRGRLSYLYYEFPEGNATTTIRSPGESLGVAVRYSAANLSATIGPSYERRQTRRRFGSGAETRETEDGLLIQGDIFYQLGSLTTLSLLGSYSGANDYAWTRAGLKRQITNVEQTGATTLHVGVEITAQGNKDSKSAQVGPMFEIAYPRVNTSLQVRTGLQRVEFSDSKTSRIYFGLGLYRAF